VYYASLLEKFGREIEGAGQETAMEGMDLESENALAAWEWAVAHSDIERLDQAMDGLGRYCQRRYRYRQGETIYQEAAQSLRVGQRPASGNRTRASAKALAWRGVFLRECGRMEPSLEVLRQALSLLAAPELTGLDTRLERAFILLQIGWSLVLRDHAEASRCFSQSLALYRSLGDQWWTATTLRGLREASSAGGDFEKGSRCARESIALYRALGDRWGIARSGWVLSVDCALQGRVEEAERVARESFALVRQLERTTLIGPGLESLGMILTWIGKYTEAQSALEQSVSQFADLDSLRPHLIQASERLAWVKMHLGDYGKARERAETCLSLAQQMGHRYWIARARLALGLLSLVDMAYGEARQRIRDSVATLREVGRRHQLRQALASLAYAARATGDNDRARRCLHECLQPGDGRGSILPLLYALPAKALLLADQGAGERAVELYALASRYQVVSNSRWFEDVAGRQIAQAAASLPPEAVAAARKRGRERDLWATVGELLAELAGY
jgi:tetratricopeptide (TPR) repeat protein